MAGGGKHKREGANARSAARSGLRRALLLLLLVVGLAAAGAAYWMQRDREPTVLTIATGPYGSDTDILMREVAEVVLRHSDTLRLRIHSSRDASQNIAMLNRKEVDAGVIRADTPVVADIRIIAGLFPDIMQLIVRADSNVYSIGDLVNARISIPPYGTDAFRSFWVIGDHYDIPIDKLDWTAEDFETGASKLLAGKVDGIFTMRSLRDSRLIRLFEDAQLKRTVMRFVPIRQAAAIALKRPFLDAVTIPAGAFTGAVPVPNVDTPSSSVERILVTREDIDPEAIRELTRILFEHRLDLTIRFSLASAITQPDGDRGLSVPLHDGAAAYYNRDDPSFLQENAEPIALMITVAGILLSGLLTLRSRMAHGQKNRADTYNYQLLDIQKRALLEDDPEEIAGMKVEINDILQTVVIALDTDEVSEEGFQSFSLLWNAVRESLNDRSRELQRSA